MDSREMLDRAIEQQQRDLAALLARRERLVSLPEEPAVGERVVFEKTYRNGGKAYSFAAVRAPQGWYLTGRDNTKPLSWSQLYDFADGAQVRLVTKTKPL